MLIVLEGLDGAGKSTQVKRLRNYLESLYGNLEYIHFPRYDAPLYGDLISRFLRGDFGNNESVHPQLVALLFAVGFVGMSSGGATRWINLGFISFQPSEVAKIGLIIFYASLLTQNKGQIREMWRGFFYPIAWLLPIIAILIGVQNHLSATILITIIIAVMMLMAGSRLKYFLTFGVAGVTAGASALFLYAKATGKGLFRITRLITFLDPFADIQGAGWQVVQSLYAIGSGGVFGSGLGQSKQKYLYLPEPQNDFIFAIVVEEFGLIGGGIVILLFFSIIYRALKLSQNVDDMYCKFLLIGLSLSLAVQVFINIGVVVGVLPVTGITLPLFSYGGSSLLINFVSFGIMLNASKYRNI